MGVAIPQIITEDRASGALVVDGGLRFTGSSYLKRTPGSTGNTTTYTISCWVKRSHLAPDGSGNTNSNSNPIFSAGTNAGSDTDDLQFYKDAGNNNAIRFVAYPGAFRFDLSTSMVFRDVSSWYHILANYDGTTAKIYINGTQVTAFASSTQNGGAGNINTTDQHVIGAACDGSTSVFRGYISQFYFIDGQALDPSYFGYTDALTNTWRPKKLSSSVAFGTNGFYLPFDGSAPIGQDQSGRGNNWTPVNFGGSNTLEKATGALPILNTDGGGKVARVGVRTDSSASSLVLALPLVGIKSDFSNAINSGTSNKAVTNTNSASFSSSVGNFYGGSVLTSSASGSSLDIPASSDFQFGSGDFTIEFWVNPVNTTQQNIMGYGNSGGGTGFAIYKTSSQFAGQFAMSDGTKTFTGGSYTTGNWYHLAFVRSGSALTLYVNGVNSASSTTSGSMTTGTDGFAVGKYGLYGGSGDAYFQDVRVYKGLAKYTSNFIPASTDPDIVPDSPSGVSYSSNLTQITDGAVAFDGSGDYLSLANSADFAFGTGDFTIECFINTKSANGGIAYLTGGSTGYWGLNINSSTFYWQSSVGVTNLWSYSASSILDGNWHHISVSRSGSLSRFFIDGILVATNTDNTNYSGTAGSLYIVRDVNLNELNGFISNLHVVKGTALYTSNFTPPSAPISSVANTKLLCCKSNSSATAFDVSPGTITANGNTAATNFNPFTVNINTQRGKQSGYCTLNPLDNYNLTVSNGNLTVSASSAHGLVRGNVGMNTATGGKYYWEYTSLGWANDPTVGIVGDTAKISDQISASPSRFYRSSGSLYVNGTENAGWGPSWTTSDAIGIAFDATNGILNFYKNGILVGSPVTGLTGTWLPGVKMYDGTSYLNFGQKPFKFPPPAGFQPLALANTPRPTIVRPDQFVGVSTWSGAQSGSGGLTRQINTTFQPDFVWIKQRNQAYSTGHQLYDSVRGAGAEKELNSSGTGAEGAGNVETYGWLNSFDKTGFTVKGGSTDYDYVDKSGVNYVGWAWKAGGNSNTFNINDVGYATASAAGLTAGTITPTGASVNTKSGFSIIKVPGTASAASFSHGLGQAPAFVILKETNGTGDWQVGHKSLSSGAWTSRLGLNLTTAEETTSSAWNNTPPTSSLITVGATSNVNNDFIVYAWAEIPGLSKFGSYTGNGSSDGPLVITGFRPKWILIKKSSATGNARGWTLVDSERSKYNVSNLTLFPHSNATEDAGTYIAVDFLSNGFKLRSTEEAANASYTYIYAAFAETPTQNLYGAQANAR